MRMTSFITRARIFFTATIFEDLIVILAVVSGHSEINKVSIFSLKKTAAMLSVSQHYICES